MIIIIIVFFFFILWEEKGVLTVYLPRKIIFKREFCVGNSCPYNFDFAQDSS